jgi:hypothetical protein
MGEPAAVVRGPEREREDHAARDAARRAMPPHRVELLRCIWTRADAPDCAVPRARRCAAKVVALFFQDLVSSTPHVARERLPAHGVWLEDRAEGAYALGASFWPRCRC